MTVARNAEGNIVYTLSDKEGNAILSESEMGITATNFPGFPGAALTALTAKRLTASYPYLGNFSTMKEDCVAAALTLENEGYRFQIEIKLYDNGAAFRYVLPYDGKSRSVRSETTSFAVFALQKVWYGQNSDCYESEIVSSPYRAVSASSKLTGPLTIERRDGGYLSLMEGYVDESYIGTNFVSAGENDTFRVSGSWTSGRDFDSFTAAGDIVTGWRVIVYAVELGDLVTNNILYNTTLSLGGSNTENGTRFEHGISTNAIGYFVYDIPENAAEFVGVVGIDDSAYANAADGYKASILCTVSADGKVLYTSPKLGQGQYDSIRVAIPEGARELKIHFGDAGDGITCDNATLAEAGFLLEK